MLALLLILFDTLGQKMLDLDYEDTLEVVMRNSLEHEKPMEMHPSEELLETVAALEPHLFHQWGTLFLLFLCLMIMRSCYHPSCVPPS